MVMRLAEKRRPVPVLVGEVGQVADGVPELLDGAAVHEAGGDVVKVVRLEPRHRGAPWKNAGSWGYLIISRGDA